MPFAGPTSARFSYFEFVRNWPELVIAMNQLEIRLRTEGHAVAADRLLKALGNAFRELEVMANEVATKATEMLRASERKTRVRPDTHGAGGPRLEDSLVAEPVEQQIAPGSVGVADEELLDNHVPWWITNEEGSSALIGHRLFGTFTGAGADAAPNADMGANRVHPLFSPGGGPDSGVGFIKNPIPARRFILKAIPGINALWEREFRAIYTRLDNELTAVLAMANTGRRP